MNRIFESLIIETTREFIGLNIKYFFNFFFIFSLGIDPTWTWFLVQLLNHGVPNNKISLNEEAISFVLLQKSWYISATATIWSHIVGRQGFVKSKFGLNNNDLVIEVSSITIPFFKGRVVLILWTLLINIIASLGRQILVLSSIRPLQVHDRDNRRVPSGIND